MDLKTKEDIRRLMSRVDKNKESKCDRIRNAILQFDMDYKKAAENIYSEENELYKNEIWSKYTKCLSDIVLEVEVELNQEREELRRKMWEEEKIEKAKTQVNLEQDQYLAQKEEIPVQQPHKTIMDRLKDFFMIRG